MTCSFAHWSSIIGHSSSPEGDFAQDANQFVRLGSELRQIGIVQQARCLDESQPESRLTGLLSRDSNMVHTVLPRDRTIGLLDVRSDRSPCPEQLASDFDTCNSPWKLSDGNWDLVIGIWSLRLR
jgi:hypothetical protein